MLKRFLAALMCMTLLLGSVDLSYAAEVVQETSSEVTIKAHFKNTGGWSQVASYFGQGDSWATVEGYEAHHSWPGKVVPADADHLGYYSVEIVKPKDSSLNIIFNNNGGGAQTADIIIPATKFASGTYEFWTDAGSSVSETAPGDWSITIESPQITEAGVVFNYYGPDASEVTLAGGMNNWTPQAMTKNADTGVWSITLPLEPGTYPYKFIADGTWTADICNPHFSGDNSLCIVPGLVVSQLEAVRGEANALPTQMSAITENGAKEDTDVTYTLVTEDENVSLDASGYVLEIGANYEADTVVMKVATADGEQKDLVISVITGTIVVSPEVEGGTVTFRYKNQDATSVAVAGTFNSWSASAALMEKDDATGVWSYTCDLAAGQYQYKFVVDGADWILDPKNSLTSELDGSENSLVIVNGTGEDTNKVTVKLHYGNRSDNDYEDWNAWIWTDNLGGQAYEFAVENGEYVATVEVEARSTYAVNYIIRKGDWEDREFSDRSIDISDVVAGTVHYYVKSGVEEGTRVLAEDALLGVKIRKAEYDRTNNRIVITTALPITGGTKGIFEITRTNGTTLTITRTNYSRVGTNHLYTLSIEEDLTSLKEVVKSYTLSYGGYTYALVMPNIYSSEEFESAYVYEGNDLGATWTQTKTTFKVWAPTADDVKVKFYKSGDPKANDATGTIQMTCGEKGVWTAVKTGDCNGIYYTYEVTVDGETTEACDPYARTTGANGERAMVINLDETDPIGWASDKSPNKDMDYTDAIIYELHVRDLSINEESGVSEEHKGKYLGLTETGTVNSTGQSTGLDHIVDLGVTHVHLLPVYDYGSVDETKLDEAQFNWGYDPVNYNVPEGSYSTDPYNGEVRVNEMKQMIQALHENNINVIMDVVYNHVYNAGEFSFNKLVPKYFSRTNADGSYSNGSGCGNDTASERAMVKKYIVDSVNYWADEYHIDGFRFDLVGLLDTETINEVVETVHQTHPEVIFYGEGWSMSTAVSKDGYTMATQGNSSKTPEFAYFSDTIRDLLKGSNDETSVGYVSGLAGQEDAIANAYRATNWWTTNPSQIINYASCHDNYTLKDKLNATRKDATEEERIRMNNLTAAIYLTAEGIPLIHAGEEMLRVKVDENGTIIHNSYKSSDYVNSLKWGDLSKESYQDVTDYYAGLIEFRKNHAALRLDTAEEVANHVKYNYVSSNVVMFTIDGKEEVEDEVSDGIVVIFNPNEQAVNVDLYAKGVSEGEWKVCINGEDAGIEVLDTITNGMVTVEPISALVLVKGETVDTDSVYTENEKGEDDGLIHAQKITLSATTLSLEMGKSGKLTATVTPAEAVERTVEWSSSNTSVVKVDSTGKLSPVSNGTAVITAKAGKVSATCEVTVTTPVEKITFDKKNLTLAIGKKATLKATVYPVTASDQKLKWESTNKSVATVSSKGVVTAKKAGTATITATAHNGVKVTCKVTVEAEKLKLSATSLSLKMGKTAKLTATVTPAGADERTIKWSSSKTSVVKVDSTGKLTPVSNGTAVITAKAGSLSATCKVTVTTDVKKISLDKKKLTLGVGKKATLKAVVYPVTASNQKLKWKSSNKSVATVSSKGVVTAKKAGTTTITATAHNGVKVTCKVTVVKVELKLAKVTGNGKKSMKVGTVKSSLKGDKVSSWTTSNKKIVTVSKTGIITAGKKNGKATVTVKMKSGATASCIVTVKNGRIIGLKKK